MCSLLTYRLIIVVRSSPSAAPTLPATLKAVRMAEPAVMADEVPCAEISWPPAL